MSTTFHGRSPGRGHGKPGPFLQSLADSGSTLLTGLVSWWDLDETSGTRADAVGSNDLTDRNTVGYASGKIGNCADFVSANSEYLDCSPGLDFSSGGFTVAGWFNQDSGWANFDYDGVGSNRVFSNDLITFYVFKDDSTFQSVTSNPTGFGVTVGEWYFGVWWWDPADGKGYVDINNSGSPNATTAIASLNSATPSFRLNRSGSGYADGRADLVGLWNRPLTADERTELYNSGAAIKYDFSDNGEGFRKDMVAYYKMEEESGTRYNSAVDNQLPSDLQTGLVSWWDMDESSGNRSDSVGSYTLTDNATVTSAAGKHGLAAEFTAANSEYLQNTSVRPPATEQFTVSGWFKHANVLNQNIIGMGADGTTGVLTVRDRTGDPRIWASDSLLGSLTGVPYGSWYMLTCQRVISGGDYKVRAKVNDGAWQDGSVITGTPATDATHGIRIGYQGVGYYEGLADNVGYWSTLLSDDQITSLYNQTRGRFYTAPYPLTDNNTVGSTTGVSGNAADFVAANSEYLSYASGGSFPSGEDDFTVSFWINPDTMAAEDYILGKGEPVNVNDWQFMLGSDRIYFYIYDASETRDGPNTGVSSVSAGTWYHVVGYQTGGVATIILNNGTPQSDTLSITPKSGGTTAAFNIGCRRSNYGFMDGQVDEVCVWNRVLSADEITALYASGSGRFYNFAV